MVFELFRVLFLEMLFLLWLPTFNPFGTGAKYVGRMNDTLTESLARGGVPEKGLRHRFLWVEGESG